jgi:hypothetical protein
MPVARWPGRHPLRRTIDRIEVMAMIALAVAFLSAAPFAAIVTSTWAGQDAAAAARVEQARAYPVAAVIVRGVPWPSNPYAAYLTKVPVRWTLDGTLHTGTIQAAAGTRDRRHRQDLDQPVRRADPGLRSGRPRSCVRPRSRVCWRSRASRCW